MSRPVVRALLVAVLLCAAVVAPRPALSLTTQTGPTQWIASVPRADFELAAKPAGAGKQRESNWCWAATVQMVLHFHGIAVTQEQVVSRIFGGLIDRPASPEMVLNALNASAFTQSGAQARITATSYRFQDASYIQDLTRAWPLIVGLKGGVPNAPGHCYVLVAVRYTEAKDGRLVPQSFFLMDPWPGNQTQVELSEPEFGRRFGFAVRVRVQRTGTPQL